MIENGNYVSIRGNRMIEVEQGITVTFQYSPMNVRPVR